MFPLLVSQLIVLICLGRCSAESTEGRAPALSIPIVTVEPDSVGEVGLNRSYGPHSSNPVVPTGCGNFEGLAYNDGKSVSYDEFLGIRYAEPPLGKLRFKYPVPFGGYQGDKTYKVTEFCPPCMQAKEDALEKSGMLPSEDCLCLNIFRPAGCNKGSKKPVLVYIPGGRFYMGSAAAVEESNAGYLAHFGDMIVVTMNYRLGPFGWLYSGDEEIPGNMGLHDTFLATKWVKEFIEDFGGDPEAITVGGHGAGATMANAYLSDLTLPKDLFRAIMILSPDYHQEEFVDPPWEAIRKSNSFANLVGCGDKGLPYGYNTKPLSPETIHCLQKADGQLLGYLANKIPRDDAHGICAWNQLMIHWEPKKGSWDERYPKGMIWHDKPVFYGQVPYESWRSFEGSIADTRKFGEEFIEREISPLIRDKSPKNIDGIVQWYFDRTKADTPYEFGRWTTTALDDVCNACVQIDIVNSIKKYNPLYYYYWLYVASCDRDSKARKYGPIHEDDEPFIFGLPFKQMHKYDDTDRAFSMEVMGILSDFVYGRKMKWPPRDPSYDPLAYLVGVGKENYYQQDPWIPVCKRMRA